MGQVSVEADLVWVRLEDDFAPEKSIPRGCDDVPGSWRYVGEHQEANTKVGKGIMAAASPPMVPTEGKQVPVVKSDGSHGELCSSFVDNMCATPISQDMRSTDWR